MGSEEIKIIDHNIFNFIFEMAVNDATNLGPNTVKNEKKGIINEKNNTSQLLKEYAENIVNGREEIDFDKIVGDLKNNNPNLSFGKIQKIINMTMKYLYIKYYDDKAVRCSFEVCHAPMDNIMSNFVFESYFIVLGLERKKENYPGFKKECSWSSMTSVDDGYGAFQNAILNIIEKGKLGINRIEFDYEYWGEAKRLKGEKTDKQIELVKEIWKKRLLEIN